MILQQTYKNAITKIGFSGLFLQNVYQIVFFKMSKRHNMQTSWQILFIKNSLLAYCNL